MPSTPMTILLVEDQQSIRFSLRRQLEEHGHSVIEAETAVAAVEAFRQKRPDLVLMDVVLPREDGYWAAREIRCQEGSDWTPIIFLSALNRDENLVEGLEAGADDYLTKPINFRQLVQVILKWTGLSLRRVSSEGAQLDSNPQIDPLQLPELDSEEGLRLAAGKSVLAADMLGMLLASLEADQIAIRNARELQDHPALLERVHRLHGATRYCGVPQLRAACQQAEPLLKEGDAGAQQALNTLEEAIRRLQQQARTPA